MVQISIGGFSKIQKLTSGRMFIWHSNSWGISSGKVLLNHLNTIKSFSWLTGKNEPSGRGDTLVIHFSNSLKFGAVNTVTVW